MKMDQKITEFRLSERQIESWKTQNRFLVPHIKRGGRIKRQILASLLQNLKLLVTYILHLLPCNREQT
uniref:Uncharacterized protein n=1 Tax=Nelumbo nucifera TaxID=4432 RepID=A0A822Z9Y5_NELNU|nr:TPA_asm: hypothetical protein HUJ06_014169 [Nelumbo nucifera]